jgi:DNA repair/transcription protein MET18/MMS19
LKSLVTLSQSYPAVIEASTLPALFHSLPDSSPTISETKARDRYRSILASLVDLCVHPALFETLVIRLLDKLDAVSTSPYADTDARECQIAYSFDLLNCIYGVLVTKIEAKHTDVIKYFDTIMPRISRLAVDASMAEEGADMPIWRDKRLLGLFGRVSDRLVWELPSE